MDAQLISEHPEPKGEVIVKTIHWGVCGTDFDVMKGYYGNIPKGYSYLVLGHEASGKVVESSSDEIKKQDYVVPVVRRPNTCDCKLGRIERCDYCSTGSFTERGLDSHGFACERFGDEGKYLIKVPQKIKNSAVLTEPLSVGSKAYEELKKAESRIPKNEYGEVLILGAGSIGMLTAKYFKENGYDVDVCSLENYDSEKVKILNRWGINYIRTEGLLKEVERKYDAIVEATGDGRIIKGVIEYDLLNPNGTLLLMGIPSGKKYENIDLNELMRKLVVKNNTVVGMINSQIRHFEDAVKFLKRNPDLKNIIKEFDVENYLDALKEFIDNPERIKIAVRFGK